MNSEKYSRGRRGAPAKGVGRETGARVQIPLSPFSAYALKCIIKMDGGFRKQLELKKFKLFFLCIMHKEEGEENDKPRVVQSKQKEIM